VVFYAKLSPISLKGSLPMQHEQKEDDAKSDSSHLTDVSIGSKNKAAAPTAATHLLQHAVTIPPAPTSQSCCPTSRKNATRGFFISSVGYLILCAALNPEVLANILANFSWISEDETKQGAALGGMIAVAGTLFGLLIDRCNRNEEEQQPRTSVSMQQPYH
jgi:hypothetical protein